ncbi:L-aminoadipate-semialdehyde dehydrogenase-phosphopantetheinyl transferase [Eurosta solidaginis]|uniref:L-aminoadipate-semialdehyde dehydrogenase-phosphopantetheinyl transferase n=1 Tax=Eurosta solidaginis TaxID=178769 RepID=UPI0035312153
MVKHKCTRWAVDLGSWSPTLQQLAQALAVIQPEERVRLLKFHFLDDYLSSLVGRLLMRKFVSTNSGVKYEDVKFARDIRGKPYWLQAEHETHSQQQLAFNVSHQGRFVVFAGITAQVAVEEDENITASSTTRFGVGVDVMKIEYSGGRSLAEFFRIMRNKFAENEWRYIKRSHHNEMDQLQAFMRHWCLKEAYVKELGVGVTIDLQKICFTVDVTRALAVGGLPLTGTILRCNDMPMHDWYFEEHLLHPKYCAAIAFKNCKPIVKSFELLSIDDLLIETEDAKSVAILDTCRNVLKKQRKTW